VPKGIQHFHANIVGMSDCLICWLYVLFCDVYASWDFSGLVRTGAHAKFFKMFTIIDILLLDEKVQNRMSALVKYGVPSQFCNCSVDYAAGTLADSQHNAHMLQKQHNMIISKQK
jgi:hypothetical protein